MAALRRWMLTGLLVAVPAVITLWVLGWVIGVLDQSLAFLPAAWQPEQWLGVRVPGFGALLTLLMLLLIGAAASNFVGRRLVAMGNALITRIPVVRGIYGGVKQISDTVFSDSGNAFRTTVLVRWPHAGMWTIGFVTGSPAAQLQPHLGTGEFVNVFVPTTPNPTGGYFVIVPKTECVELPIRVEEALKYVVSMGVVAPVVQNPSMQNPVVQNQQPH